MAGAAAAIRIPALQPKRTIPLVPKTNERVMPLLSALSLATGYRLAAVEATRSTSGPTSSVGAGGVAANEIATASAIISPAPQTGTTSSSRGTQASAAAIRGTNGLSADYPVAFRLRE